MKERQRELQRLEEVADVMDDLNYYDTYTQFGRGVISGAPNYIFDTSTELTFR